MSHPTQSLLRVTEREGTTFASFESGSVLTGANAEELGRELAAFHEGREAPRVVLDLSGVAMLTSVVLAKLIGLNGKVRAAGGRLTLLNPAPIVRQVFTVTRLDTILDVRDDPTAIPA